MELEKFLEYQGFDPKKIKELEEDKAKAEFDTSFIRKNAEAIRKDEIYGEVVGKLTGAILTKTKSYFKENNIELDPEEIKGKAVEDVFNIGLIKLKGSLSTKITELEAKQGLSNDEAVKALEKERDKYKGLAEDFKGKFSGLGAEFETYKTTIATESKNKTLKDTEEKAFSSVKFKSDISTYEKKGFISDIKESYSIELDETGKAIPMKDGKAIPNPKKAGTIYELDEFLQEKAIEAKLYAINPHGNRPIQPTITPKINQAVIAQRPVNSRAL